jgi:hypothetical protein
LSGETGRSRLLSQTGAVSGEYGFAEAYEKKREDLKSWPHDNKNEFKKFIGECDTYLEKLAVHARKEATVDIELRKRRFEK